MRCKKCRGSMEQFEMDLTQEQPCVTWKCESCNLDCQAYYMLDEPSFVYWSDDE